MVLLLPGCLAFKERRFITAFIMLIATIAPIVLLCTNHLSEMQVLLTELTVLFAHFIGLTARLAVWRPQL